MRLLRRVGHGDLIPAGFGFCWSRWQTDEAVFAPIPLNLVLRAGRGVWLWFKRGGTLIPHGANEAYEQGRRDERAQWERWAEDGCVEFPRWH